ncbi:NADP-dependent oxidoreductase domain-containing protein [Mycena vulgaris]|nr:NADP-dependent oxidoreductase domain-containing protein [Mycena vulgaris]
MSSTRKIGISTFSSIDFGARGISPFYGDVGSDEERLEVLDAAHAAGCALWDTVDMYGDLEELFGKWRKRDQTFLCTKLGFLEDYTLDGSSARVKAAAESSLTKLGVESIDFTADAKVPIEGGKVKHTGLSEVPAATLRRAHARELGIQIVAYSPLGRGLLTGQHKSLDDFDESDFRGYIPRYNAQNFPNILKLADGQKEIGVKYDGVTAGQVAPAWLLARAKMSFLSLGRRKSKYLKESLGAASLKLSAEDVEAVREVAKTADVAQGERYTAGDIQNCQDPPIQAPMLRLCKRLLSQMSRRSLAASISTRGSVSLPQKPLQRPPPSAPHAAPYSSSIPSGHIDLSTTTPLPAPGEGEWYPWDVHDAANAICAKLGLPGTAEPVAWVDRPDIAPLYIFLAAGIYWGYAEDTGVGSELMTVFSGTFASHEEFLGFHRDGEAPEDPGTRDEFSRRLERVFRSMNGRP